MGGKGRDGCGGDCELRWMEEVTPTILVVGCGSGLICRGRVTIPAEEFMYNSRNGYRATPISYGFKIHARLPLRCSLSLLRI